MTKDVLLILTIIIVVLADTKTASAQFTIKIPKIPKAQKTSPAAPVKTESFQPETARPPMARRVDDEPTIVKASVQVSPSRLFGTHQQTRHKPI